MELKNLRALSFSERQIFQHPLGSARAVGQHLWEATSTCGGVWSRSAVTADFRQGDEH